MKQSSFHSIEQVEEFLYSIPKFGSVGRSAANFSLDRMISFCARMGNPEKSVPMIHVAGTNGKGTTCQMLASVYQQAGFNTGLYTSPHLMDVRERFRINSAQIKDEDLLRFFKLYGDYAATEGVTFFELTTAIAFWFFAEQKADLAVIETGLGGRLDATNVITPLISVITSIGMDHTDILGDTIEKIAKEKAGIIKFGRPVVLGDLQPEAMNVVEEVAGSHNSEVLKVESLQPGIEGDRFILSEGGRVLQINATERKEIDRINLAMTRLVVTELQTVFPVSDEAFVSGIEQMNSRFAQHAHFEKVHPDQNWYFDGAHNEQAIEVLTQELRRMSDPENWSVVLSFMKDKLNPAVAKLWSPFPEIALYEQKGERAATMKDMKELFPGAISLDEKSVEKYLSSKALKRELVIFSGSFYFYNTVRHWMGTEAVKKK